MSNCDNIEANEYAKRLIQNSQVKEKQKKIMLKKRRKDKTTD